MLYSFRQLSEFRNCRDCTILEISVLILCRERI